MKTNSRLGPGFGFITLLSMLAFLAGAATVRATSRPVFQVEAAKSSAESMPGRLALAVDLAALRAGPPRIALPIPGDAILGEEPERRVFASRRLEIRPDGDVVWQGCAGPPEDCADRLVLRLHHERLTGIAFAPEGTFEILPRGAGAAILQRVDDEAFPPCGVREPRPAENGTSPTASRPVHKDGETSTVTVLALYSDAARDGAGGVAEIESAILAAADLTNSIFADGPIDAQLSVVHMERFDLGLLGELPDLQVAIDRLKLEPGVMALRDQVNADLVALILEGGAGLCGIAEAMDDVSTAFAPEAYSITVRSCLVSALAFPHEIGHNLGARHNPEDSEATPETASFPWSFGHVGSSFRTLMAYNTTCQGPCPRVPYFSDPDRLITRGSSVDEPAGIEGERDNVRTLQATTPVAAAFRGEPEEVTCVDSATRKCLLGGRFAVEVTWADFIGRTGDGYRLDLPSDESVLFWFFGAQNWELLVKVLDACTINQRIWVFTAGSTNVGYLLTVTDTRTGVEQVYENPLGRTAVTVTDIEAFASCSG